MKPRSRRRSKRSPIRARLRSRGVLSIFTVFNNGVIVLARVRGVREHGRREWRQLSQIGAELGPPSTSSPILASRAAEAGVATGSALEARHEALGGPLG